MERATIMVKLIHTIYLNDAMQFAMLLHGPIQVTLLDVLEWYILADKNLWKGLTNWVIKIVCFTTFCTKAIAIWLLLDFVPQRYLNYLQFQNSQFKQEHSSLSVAAKLCVLVCVCALIKNMPN